MQTGLLPAQRSALAATLLMALVCRAQALPVDLRVLTDDLTGPGGLAVELQGSQALSRAGAAGDGATARQALLELSTGLAPQWELSLQLPATREAGTWRGTGANLELTFVAPHDEDDGGYLGWRAELGRARPSDEPAAWAWEWRPILGWREGSWHGVLNLGFSANASGSDTRVRFEPAGKLAWQLARPLALGLEAFVDGGPVSRLLPRRERSEIALVVADGQFGACNLTLGVGKGFAGAAEGRVLKVLLSYAMEGSARP